MKNATEPLHITVKKKMVEKNLRQRDVAEHFGCDKSYVSKALKGQRQYFMVRIAEYVFRFKSAKAA
jgi:predicted XRE-type DNA-binding protein